MKTIFFVTSIISISPVAYSLICYLISRDRPLPARLRTFAYKQFPSLLAILLGLGFIFLKGLIKSPDYAFLASHFDFAILLIGIPIGIITYIIDISAESKSISIKELIKYQILTNTIYIICFASLFYIQLPDYDERLKFLLHRFIINAGLIGTIIYVLKDHIKKNGWPNDIPSNLVIFSIFLGGLLTMVAGWIFGTIYILGITLAGMISAIWLSPKLEIEPSPLFRILSFLGCAFLFMISIIAIIQSL